MTKTLLQSLGDEISRAIKRKRLSFAKAAEVMGISENELYAIRKGMRQKPNPRFLLAISNYTGLSFEKLLEKSIRAQEERNGS